MDSIGHELQHEDPTVAATAQESALAICGRETIV